MSLQLQTVSEEETLNERQILKLFYGVHVINELPLGVLRKVGVDKLTRVDAEIIVIQLVSTIHIYSYI